MNPKMINKIIFKFVINNLPIISEEPNHIFLNNMIQFLHVNATTLTKKLAGGENKHLIIIMKDNL